ncbi:ATP-binding protein [Aliihoeflea sp. PC F10.4]
MDKNQAKNSVVESVSSGSSRPTEMTMQFMSSTLRTLGADMYSNLGKVLVEFVANAYDADASKVDIKIDFDEIGRERERLKAEYKARLREVGPGPDDEDASDLVASFDIMHQTMRSDVTIVIEDDGHGMTWSEVQDNFLPVNRQRRMDRNRVERNLRTKSGKRMVMGRKGVGKLAGFGAALTAVVETSVAGEPEATRITIDIREVNETTAISALPLPVEYLTKETTKSGTIITLSNLRADALKETKEKIESTIAQRFFGIKADDFAISINGEPLEPYRPDYVFIHPRSLSQAQIDTGEMAAATFDVQDVGTFDFQYYVGFRNRSLKGSERGARIYCNKRLAAGPSLFGLKTGMHNFYGSDYMECMVEADILDRGGVDLIATDRGDLKEGNEIVDSFLDAVRRVMEDAIKDHGKWRDEKAVQDLQSDPVAKLISKQIEILPKKTREPSRKLLQIFARDYDVSSDEFKELAPALIQSINSSEILIKLSSAGVHLKTIQELAGQLREVAEIERWDSLKLYRARKNGILKLQSLLEKSRDDWKKRQYEKDFHDLLKENPWLIRPEFSHFVTSDMRMSKVVSQIARDLKVDEYAPVMDGDKEDIKRPDLVFLASEPSLDGPFIIKIVELKSPTIPLRLEHWRQLEDYVLTTEDWCKTNLPHRVNVQGLLIGELPDAETSVREEINLIGKYAEQQPRERIRIVGMTELLKDARTAHMAAIDAIEKELGDDDAETADSLTLSLPAPA